MTPKAVNDAKQWIEQLSSGPGAKGAAGVTIGQQWTADKPADGLPLAGLVWRTTAGYLRNAPCPRDSAPDASSSASPAQTPAPPDAEQCAVIATHLRLRAPKSQHPATSDPLRARGMTASGTWTGSGESTSYVSLAQRLGRQRHSDRRGKHGRHRDQRARRFSALRRDRPHPHESATSVRNEAPAFLSACKLGRPALYSNRCPKKERIFLSAEWRDLVMLNYEVEPELLRERVPPGTQLDSFEGKTYVSLVGFRFCRTKLLGFLPVPFHAILTRSISASMFAANRMADSAGESYSSRRLCPDGRSRPWRALSTTRIIHLTR